MSFYHTATQGGEGGTGAEVLVGLINFIRPITPSTQFQLSLRDLCDSTEGDALLNSLKTFLALILKPQVDPAPGTETCGLDIVPYYPGTEYLDLAGHSSTPDFTLPMDAPSPVIQPTTNTDPSTEPHTLQIPATAQPTPSTEYAIKLNFEAIGTIPEPQLSSNSSSPSNISVPRPLSDSNELPSDIKDQIYMKVFNDMPIRVIAFDSKGGDLRLIERNGIASLILSFMQYLYEDKTNDDDYDDNAFYEESLRYFCRYAILSHTWIRGEPGDVLYQGWEERESPENEKGYSKITNFCQVAAVEHDILFGWMDTVCINKASSSELDESIRSMYKWYKSAHVCITYLADTTTIPDMSSDSWFTRGWTLQELLAPRNIQFYNQSWQHLVPTDSGIRTNHMDSGVSARKRVTFRLDNHQMPLVIQHQIFTATTITENELFVFHTSHAEIPLSRVMQLASRRRVTREEDKVYSLMGLLGVGIPVSYGEGSVSAMRRLIREIMVSTTKFMDIFNHSSQAGIIPRDITAYTDGSPLDGASAGATLDDLTRPKPVLLTHMGVHLTLLAVPAFRKDTYEEHIPLESGGRVVLLPILPEGDKSFQRTTPVEFILLDNSKHSEAWTNGLVTLTDGSSNGAADESSLVKDRSVVFLAILSSSADHESEEYFLLSPQALCIVMSSDKPGGSKLSDMRPKRQISGAIPVTLPYLWHGGGSASSPPEIVSITAEQADKMGFKVVTYYFT